MEALRGKRGAQCRARALRCAKALLINESAVGDSGVVGWLNKCPGVENSAQIATQMRNGDYSTAIRYLNRTSGTTEIEVQWRVLDLSGQLSPAVDPARDHALAAALIAIDPDPPGLHLGLQETNARIELSHVADVLGILDPNLKAIIAR
jgi:hypothetical protein